MLRYAVGRVRPYISGRLAPERVTVGDGGHPRGADPVLPRFGRECQMVLRTHRGPDAFDRLDLRGDVLELAPGTGIWTERLTRTARSVTAVDASEEMIAINRERMGEAAATVSYVQADLFAWEPTRRFDAAVFCFWISHVPRERLDAFLQTVSDALETAGRVFFVDGRRQPSSTAIDHDLPDPGSEVMTRRLNDGRAYRIVKNFWPSEELKSRCRRARLDVTVAETATYFQYGYGQKA